MLDFIRVPLLSSPETPLASALALAGYFVDVPHTKQGGSGSFRRARRSVSHVYTSYATHSNKNQIKTLMAWGGKAFFHLFSSYDIL